MRSRYCAFVLQDADYLLGTWHPVTRPSKIDFEQRQKWLGLKVVSSERGGAEDHEGVVEFIARYRIDGRAYRLREVSRFERISGRWYYRDGDPESG